MTTDEELKSEPSLMRCWLKKSYSVSVKVGMYLGGIAVAFIAAYVVWLGATSQKAAEIWAAFTSWCGSASAILSNLIGSVPWPVWAALAVIGAIVGYSGAWCLARRFTNEDWQSDEAKNAFAFAAFAALATASPQSRTPPPPPRTRRPRRRPGAAPLSRSIAETQTRRIAAREEGRRREAVHRASRGSLPSSRHPLALRGVSGRRRLVDRECGGSGVLRARDPRSATTRSPREPSSEPHQIVRPTPRVPLVEVAFRTEKVAGRTHRHITPQPIRVSGRHPTRWRKRQLGEDPTEQRWRRATADAPRGPSQRHRRRRGPQQSLSAILVESSRLPHHGMPSWIVPRHSGSCCRPAAPSSCRTAVPVLHRSHRAAMSCRPSLESTRETMVSGRSAHRSSRTPHEVGHVIPSTCTHKPTTPRAGPGRTGS